MKREVQIRPLDPPYPKPPFGLANFPILPNLASSGEVWVSLELMMIVLQRSTFLLPLPPPNLFFSFSFLLLFYCIPFSLLPLTITMMNLEGSFSPHLFLLSSCCAPTNKHGKELLSLPFFILMLLQQSCRQ